jgi:hypothetical protein
MDPYLLSLLTFFLGLILGHRLTLWRDKRKEFNEIAQPIRVKLLNEREAVDTIVPGPSEIDADQLEGMLPLWNRRRFRKTWDAYCCGKEQTTQDSFGGLSYANPEQIIEHIDRLLSLH